MPHHNLVATTRQEFLKSISIKRPITRHIILLSPDHFGSNQFQITSSSRNWDLSTGIAIYNNILNLDIPQKDNLLSTDHGIYNPLTDLKTYFPQADFYPILIGQNTSPQQLETILEKIILNCHFDCLLVASVDFSHYLPSSLAAVHDAYTINNLQNLDSDKILQSEVDSPQSLYLITKFAQKKDTLNWYLFAHTNSGIISQNPDIETTTHVFGSFSKGKFKPSSNLTFVHLPHKLVRSENQTTLGDRFFYGVDKSVVDSYLPNFVIGQISYPNHTIKSFYPLKENNFIRGPEKQALIKKYFDSISDENVTKDYFWGTLTYEK